MADAGTVVSLKDRGQCVLTSIDLFDEGQLGAGQLIFRGRYNTIDEVKSAISEVLAASPIEDPETATSILSLNRFNLNNPHGYRTYDYADAYPNKARWLVHFLLRFNFGGDLCYVDLGLNWAPFRLANGLLNPKYPLGDYTMGQQFTLADMKILRVCLCSVDDAVELVKSFGLTDPTGLEIIDASAGVSQEQLDALQTDGDVLTAKGISEDYILTYENELLTIKSGE